MRKIIFYNCCMVAENQGWCSMVVEKPLKDALLIVLINNFFLIIINFNCKKFSNF